MRSNIYGSRFKPLNSWMGFKNILFSCFFLIWTGLFAHHSNVVWFSDFINCSSQLISFYFVAVFYFVWYPFIFLDVQDYTIATSYIKYFTFHQIRPDDPFGEQMIRNLEVYWIIHSLSSVLHYFWTRMSKQISDSLWHSSISRTEYGFKICFHMKWWFLFSFRWLIRFFESWFNMTPLVNRL